MAEPVNVVRTLTGLTADEMPDLTFESLLELNDQEPRLAAADALETYAGQLITAVQSDDMSIDGSKRATVLMSRAASLREQAATAADDGAFAFDVVFPTSYRPELTERGY